MTIWIDETTKKRVNIMAPYKGFSRLDTPEIRERAGLIEVPEPTPPSDYSEDTYYRTEQDEAPYVVYTRKSDEQIAAVRWQRIKAKRDDLTDNGGCLVDGKWFHSDAKSKRQQIALVIMGASIPAGLMWKTMDGSFVAMTQALAGQVFSAQTAREQSIFAHAEALNADPEADIDAGWPARYEVIK